MRRDTDEQGMILVNVLLFVAIASGLVLLLITREELALDQSVRMREAARAMAAVEGGELSAIVALRRDQKDAPDVDYAAEGWGAVAEAATPIEGGTFELAIADAEGRFNINALRRGDASSLLLFQTLADTAGFDEDQVVQAIGYVRSFGPVTDLRPLRLAGFDPAKVDRLERLVTALPGNTTINLNAADPELLTILFRDPVSVQRLLETRKRNGHITSEDLSRQGVVQPPGTSFRSNTFWVRTRATIGETSQQFAALIQRRVVDDDRAETVPVMRWWNAAVPPGAPAFPVKPG